MRGLLFALGAAASVLSAQGLDTAMLQARLDAVAASGGGRVSVAPGIYTVANLALRNGVELHLEKGCVLQASTNRLDYGYPDDVRGLPSTKPTGVVIAVGVTNAALTGFGVLDGRGTCYDRVLERGKGQYPVKMRGGWGCFRALDCRGLKIDGVTMRDPVTWTCFLRRCEDVTIRGLTIRAHANWNNDGLDLQVRRAVIADCDIDSEDDALVFKTVDDGWETGQVEVRDSVFSSSASFIKFGTETKGAFRDYEIHHCRILAREPARVNTRRSAEKDRQMGIVPAGNGAMGSGGIVVAMVDGGQLERVRLHDIEIGAGVQVPIFVRLGRRRAPKAFDRTYLRDVTLENITMTAPAASRVASSVTGVPGLEAENVTLRNISFILPGGGTPTEAAATVREAETSYPSAIATFKGVLPAHGLFTRHVKNFKAENITCRLLSPDARPAEKHE